MEAIAKTTDPIALCAYQAVLQQAGIASVVLDVHTSVLEGSLGVLPRRLMVKGDDVQRARRILEAYQQDLADGRVESMDRPDADADADAEDTADWGGVNR